MLDSRDVFPNETQPGMYPLHVRILARLSPFPLSREDLVGICDLSGWHEDYDKAQGQAGAYEYPLQIEGRD
jgi:hypothetical protein